MRNKKHTNPAPISFLDVIRSSDKNKQSNTREEAPMPKSTQTKPQHPKPQHPRAQQPRPQHPRPQHPRPRPNEHKVAEPSMAPQTEAPVAAPVVAPEPIAAPEPLKTWQEMGLSAATLEIIEKAGFKNPTPIQAKALPLALERNDLIASAETGSGKTAAFVLPMVERFAGKEGTYGLILAPTREIAQQTQATLEIFGTPRGVRSIVLIGGVPMNQDAAAIQTYPQIIVATPGRLCDHLDRGQIWLDFVQMVVLDEADRMLDMGFSDQLSRIMMDVPKERQTMVFSATFSPAVEGLARKILNNPTRITIGSPRSSAATIEHHFWKVDEGDKLRELKRIMREQSGQIIVFLRSKDRASRLWRSLHSANFFDVTYIHSDRPQADREKALTDFRAGTYRVLIATDVAARGIHVDDVALVVNYDLPLEPEDFIHRVGRTGRKGAKGISCTFVTPSDRSTLGAIERFVDPTVKALIQQQIGPMTGGGPERGRGGSSGRRGPPSRGRRR